MSYTSIPLASVDAVHFIVTEVAVLDTNVRLPGAVGGVVSTPGAASVVTVSGLLNGPQFCALSLALTLNV
ncbi:hypothetical protein D3C71_1971880 [compost metagenome]